MQLGSPQNCASNPEWANQNYVYDAASGKYPGVSTIADSNIPRNVTMTMPQFTSEAQQVAPNPQPQLTPADLLKPLPSIVSTAPTELPAPCDGMADWIGKNPMMAVGILAGFAWLVLGDKSGRVRG